MLQRRYGRYELILFHNYFITVVYYYRTRPMLFLYFFFVLTFYILKFFHYCFLLFLYGIYNFISDAMFYFCLHVYLCYSIDSTIIGSRITSIMCSFIEQRINLKQHSIVSNNLNGVKPQSHALSHHEFISRKCFIFFFCPCHCTSSTQALKSCKETNSRGFIGQG